MHIFDWIVLVTGIIASLTSLGKIDRLINERNVAGVIYCAFWELLTIIAIGISVIHIWF